MAVNALAEHVQQCARFKTAGRTQGSNLAQAVSLLVSETSGTGISRGLLRRSNRTDTGAEEAFGDRLLASGETASRRIGCGSTGAAGVTGAAKGARCVGSSTRIASLLDGLLRPVKSRIKNLNMALSLRRWTLLKQT
jgi:hypothetical protein